MSTFSYKGYGGRTFWDFRDFSLDILHGDLNWNIVLESKTKMREKSSSPIIFAFFGQFFKNFGWESQFWTPTLRIPFPPYPIVLLPKANEAFWLYYERFLSGFLHAGLNWDPFFEFKKMGREISPQIFLAFFVHFFKKRNL